MALHSVSSSHSSSRARLRSPTGGGSGSGSVLTARKRQTVRRTSWGQLGEGGDLPATVSSLPVTSPCGAATASTAAATAVADVPAGGQGWGLGGLRFTWRGRLWRPCRARTHLEQTARRGWPTRSPGPGACALRRGMSSVRGLRAVSPDLRGTDVAQGPSPAARAGQRARRSRGRRSLGCLIPSRMGVREDCPGDEVERGVSSHTGSRQPFSGFSS